MKDVLIIDDDPSALLLLQKSLEKLSYNIFTAQGGRKGIKRAQSDYYDLILLDLKMEQVDGFEVINEVHRAGASRKSPIIIVSSHSDQKSVTRAMEMGAADFVVKPYDAGTLMHKVTRWANTKTEEEWEALEPEQSRALRLTVSTLDKAYKAVLQKKPLPYQEFKQTGKEVASLVSKGTVKPVLESLKKHDSYTFVHSMRVGIFLSLFARSVDMFQEEDIRVVTEGGIIHDVGKAKIPLKVLNKPGAFEPEEWEEMKSHVQNTVDALYLTPGVPEPVIEIGWCHHEKLDGTGYPRGLKGEEIGILARMASIVDAYSALTDRRVYKPGFSHEKSIGILEGAPNHFDPDLVQEFRQVLEDGGYHKT